MILVFILFSFL